MLLVEGIFSLLPPYKGSLRREITLLGVRLGRTTELGAWRTRYSLFALEKASLNASESNDHGATFSIDNSKLICGICDGESRKVLCVHSSAERETQHRVNEASQITSLVLEMAPKNHRGTSLLLILQAWIIPCHGFSWIPPYRGALSYAAHDHARLGSVPASRTGGRPAPGSIKGIPQLRMSQRGGAFYERFEDDYSSDQEDEKVVRCCEENGCRVKLNATLYRYCICDQPVYMMLRWCGA